MANRQGEYAARFVVGWGYKNEALQLLSRRSSRQGVLFANDSRWIVLVEYLEQMTCDLPQPSSRVHAGALVPTEVATDLPTHERKPTKRLLRPARVFRSESNRSSRRHEH